MPEKPQNCHSGERDCVVIMEITTMVVMPVQTGIQKSLILLDSWSRFACPE